MVPSARFGTRESAAPENAVPAASPLMKKRWPSTCRVTWSDSPEEAPPQLLSALHPSEVTPEKPSAHEPMSTADVLIMVRRVMPFPAGRALKLAIGAPPRR